jgi:hypothetical protein
MKKMGRYERWLGSLLQCPAAVTVGWSLKSQRDGFTKEKTSGEKPSGSQKKYKEWKMIVGWIPIFREVRGKSIGGDLYIDDEGFEQRQFEPVQSLHHGSIGYQHVHTRIGLAKKAMSLQVNWEHKQEQERIISNCRWMISSRKLRSYKSNVGESVLDRLI